MLPSRSLGRFAVCSARAFLRTLTVLGALCAVAWSQALAQPPATPPQTPPPAATAPAQDPASQAPPAINIEVVVSAPRMDVPLRVLPAATSIVAYDDLKALPRGIGAEEAFKLVPGLKIDNQADGERVHVSIRGQGLLTERGVRGIKVLQDGLPLNDPTGFAPDLFDVDWLTVNRVEVFRGPSSAIYGGGAAGGVINITTADGPADRAAAGTAIVNLGSYGFWKALAEAGGTKGDVNYRVSVSSNAGDGYRDHTAFDATNVYGKMRWTPSTTFHLNAVVAGTHYFNENAEGLNLDWLRQDRRMANPDALTYNEYQQTDRFTSGVNGQWTVGGNQDVMFSVYMRHTIWEESVPSSVQHRTYNTPGAILQYGIHNAWGTRVNHLTLGADLDWQGIDDYKHPNLGLAAEGSELLSDQYIHQTSTGWYAMDRLELSAKWSLMADLRGDHLTNRLDDHLQAGGVDLSGSANFGKATGRVGAAYAPTSSFSVYGSWGQGFLPPATEELANNPYHQGGFNPDLMPATSMGEEIGFRGVARVQFSYDVTVFHLATEDDFGRYRVPGRPLETFYRNAGDSQRYGLETAMRWMPTRAVAIRGAYTYSDFKYTNIKSLFGDFSDQVMPNAPAHQAYLDAEYAGRRGWVAGLGLEAQSGWYVDQTNVAWSDGFVLVNPRIGYRWSHRGYTAEVSLSARNVFNVEYNAFTEPDPDGNSYQPGPTREVFLGLRVGMGR
jgi:iron complex outermembrane recepter protein